LYCLSFFVFGGWLPFWYHQTFLSEPVLAQTFIMGDMVFLNLVICGSIAIFENAFPLRQFLPPSTPRQAHFFSTANKNHNFFFGREQSIILS
jgi:hypothetical protein